MDEASKKRLLNIYEEITTTSGMLEEIIMKTKLIQNKLDNGEDIEEEAAESANKYLEDINRYRERFEEIIQETEDIYGTSEL